MRIGNNSLGYRKMKNILKNYRKNKMNFLRLKNKVIYINKEGKNKNKKINKVFVKNNVINIFGRTNMLFKKKKKLYKNAFNKFLKFNDKFTSYNFNSKFLNNKKKIKKIFNRTNYNKNSKKIVMNKNKKNKKMKSFFIRDIIDKKVFVKSQIYKQINNSIKCLYLCILH